MRSESIDACRQHQLANACTGITQTHAALAAAPSPFIDPQPESCKNSHERPCTRSGSSESLHLKSCNSTQTDTLACTCLHFPNHSSSSNPPHLQKLSKGCAPHEHELTHARCCNVLAIIVSPSVMQIEPSGCLKMANTISWSCSTLQNTHRVRMTKVPGRHQSFCDPKH